MQGLFRVGGEKKDCRVSWSRTSSSYVETLAVELRAKMLFSFSVPHSVFRLF